MSWYGGDLQLFSRVKTLGMGGLFIGTPNPPPVGTKIRLAFEVPGGSVKADAIVGDIIPGEGLGVEFTPNGLRRQTAAAKADESLAKLNLALRARAELERRSIQ